MTGHELKEKRQSLGMSQEQLARSLEVNLSTLAQWEQLKGDEIPNSKLLDLSVMALETANKKQRWLTI
jgi:DNA-binding transcriptional regulator YiaG